MVVQQEDDCVALSDWIELRDRIDHTIDYEYQGICPQTGEALSLPRTRLAEAVAYGLMRRLEQWDPSPTEGKMFGVLVVETSPGYLAVLKAFSGLWRGEAFHKGWVPPTPGREWLALEEQRTVQQLREIKQELIESAAYLEPLQQQVERLRIENQEQTRVLAQKHKDNKQRRAQQRDILQQELQGTALDEALECLKQESWDDTKERSRHNQQSQDRLQPHLEALQQAEEEMLKLRQKRKAMSRQLQQQMHQVYRLTNFAGVEMTLREILPQVGIPTGTGECCAPKLLHYAATHRWRPVGMAEFWWGPETADGQKQHRQFYGACVERCQPIMGFLLSGLSMPLVSSQGDTDDFRVVYEDSEFLVVDKPSGLLSVPGRAFQTQDCVAHRVRQTYPDITGPVSVHRLDQDTSGLLVLARNPKMHSLLSQLFQNRKIHKEYTALLHGCVVPEEGEIVLPLARDPDKRPCQRVDWQHGKPSKTQFQVLERTSNYTRIRLIPWTGRTHQLRVHMADPQGLHAPIVGDLWYGNPHDGASRLHLHASLLHFTHPLTGRDIRLICEPSF